MAVADKPQEGAAKDGNADASVLVGGTRYDLPVRKGTLGPDVIDTVLFIRTRAASAMTQASPPRQAASQRSRSSTLTRG
jgi:hypothetical protein